ncbi:MAG TPA: sulfotransferase [Candidatus Binatia bacterium]|nr:sulfotransferase [Candidatus Binatia bacterium]
MRRSKIFGLGLSRTGTTSLTEALEILGFSTIHYCSGPMSPCDSNSWTVALML